MKSVLFRRYLLGVIGVATLSLGMSGSANALFPPPFYYPPTTTTGEVVPPDPPTIPDPQTPPPCECCCPCGGGTGVATTPEPATMISGMIGLSMAAIVAIRRRKQK